MHVEGRGVWVGVSTRVPIPTWSGGRGFGSASRAARPRARTSPRALRHEPHQRPCVAGSHVQMASTDIRAPWTTIGHWFSLTSAG